MMFKNRYPTYILTTVAVLLLTLLEVNVSWLANGLLATPFLMIVMAVALFADYTSSAIAIILATASVLYVLPPSGFHLSSDSIFKAIEFLAVSLIVTALAWQMRAYRRENSALVSNVEKLTAIIKDLKKISRGSSREIKKLNDINKNLTNLVNEFMDDDDYWNKRLAADMKQEDSKR